MSNQMEIEKLKACLCGGHPVFKDKCDTYSVECDRCGNSTGLCHIPPHAISIWNTRYAGDESAKTRIEATGNAIGEPDLAVDTCRADCVQPFPAPNIDARPIEDFNHYLNSVPYIRAFDDYPSSPARFAELLKDNRLPGPEQPASDTHRKLDPASKEIFAEGILTSLAAAQRLNPDAAIHTSEQPCFDVGLVKICTFRDLKYA
ncbi:hypothetical protein [Singulisphaera sp. PoT]|uniref:hypothetical protein n=1 Tax=Singulisphaera sp. PoT TaxID=3411797 RepID=UPI003BF5EE44